MMEQQEVLVEGRFEVWQQLAADIAARHRVETLQKPETCMVMMQAKDSVEKTPFYLGEALMCEAGVQVDGTAGYGFALEDEPERVWCLAVIDAALTAHLPEEQEIRAAIAAEERRLQGEQQRERDLVASTMVRFAMMEGQ